MWRSRGFGPHEYRPTAGQEAGDDEEGAGGGGGGGGGTGGGGGGGDEFFGIAYQSTHRKKSDYQVPSGPAFADEREFEKELRASAVNVMNRPATV